MRMSTDNRLTETAARRIQRKRAKGWKLPAGCVCVDRSTGFGNPFPIAKGESRSEGVSRPIWVVGTWTGPGMWFKDTREEAISTAVAAYRAWINSPSQETLREKAVVALRGRSLACWCPEGSPCHADVLLEIANG